ncbi:MAG TPA: DUF433 domain-containing protein [Candidatus Acidoferrales bacterium]|jgi:uncharacterized protein (DUF433 family)|nr:DUF433 domain-containing protein [Candidatus Acidoferrales bacterium]
MVKTVTGAKMQREYVELRNGGYYVSGSRVSLASIIYDYREGAAAETIRQNFPTLSLEQVHGAIAFYLGNREEADVYLRNLERKWDELEQASIPADPELQARIVGETGVIFRFQADADLKHAILARTLRQSPSLDFRRAETVPLEGLDDPEVLAMAAADGRVLVSDDLSTMEGHFKRFIQTRKIPGLILIPQIRVTIARAIETLVLIAEVLDPCALENRVCLFPSLVIY